MKPTTIEYIDQTTDPTFRAFTNLATEIRQLQTDLADRDQKQAAAMVEHFEALRDEILAGRYEIAVEWLDAAIAHIHGTKRNGGVRKK